MQYGDSLTPRELDVLRLLAQGMSHGEIATALSLSKNTISSYLNNAYSKLQVATRKDAVSKCQELGLLDRS
jgi:LuxR family maltose regulon positive regulatory protein